MNKIQFISVTPEELQEKIIQGVQVHIEDLKNHFTPKDPEVYLTRKEVSNLLTVSLVTLNKWNKTGRLKAYGIGKRVLYKQSDINNSLIEL